MEYTPLARQLAARISGLIAAEGFALGARLVERTLADELRVSRSPVRSALRILEAEGIVVPSQGGGYEVAEAGRHAPPLVVPASEDEAAYLRIAEDRLEGALPERVTETALMRRYDLTRSRLAAILRRMAAEGWIERLPGHGWAFVPMLTSLQSYADSYRYRLVIEPAAILQPTFVLDREALAARRAEQVGLVEGAIWSVSGAELFDLNSRLHEAVIECSRNDFFVEGLRRIDRVRRLIEYKQALDREHAVLRCREHVRLVDLLLADRRADAAEFMRAHLSSLIPEKTPAKRTPSGRTATPVAVEAEGVAGRGRPHDDA